MLHFVVVHKVHFSRQRFPAYATPKLAVVKSLVVRQIGLGLERLPTGLTFKRPRVGMRGQVRLQVEVVGEGPLTHGGRRNASLRAASCGC